MSGNHAFYIEMDNGFWMPQRLIKVGSFDIGVVQALKASIDRLRTSDTVSWIKRSKEDEGQIMRMDKWKKLCTRKNDNSI